jgi:antitoxin component YwqK of YwqJK toxin-antitoxin module
MTAMIIYCHDIFRVNSVLSSYYENGQIEYKIHYKNGNKDGEWISYYENGRIKGKINYKNGKEDDGEWVSYYEDGQIKEKRTYKDGKRVDN